MELPPDHTQDASFDSLYSPLARVLPVLRQPPKSVLGSLHVVESYFGAELSPNMVEVAARLSVRQMIALETEIAKEQDSTQSALSVVDRPRQNPEFKSYPWWRRDPRPPILRSSEEFFQKINSRFAWTKRLHIAGANEISIHDEVLPTSVQDINQVPMLKHLALYSEHTAIRDPLERFPPGMYGQSEPVRSLEARRRRLANGLRQLLPIAPLIRDGTFILVGGETNASGVFSTGPGRTDPFLWWLLGRYRPDIQQEITELHTVRDSPLKPGQPYRWELYDRLATLDTHAQAVVRQHYPYHVSDPEWEQLIAMVRWTSRYSLAPVTTNPIIVRHLVQGAHIAFEGSPRPANAAAYPSPQSAAVTYQMPPLGECRLTDISRLRQSSLFDDVRTALLRVATECAESNPQSYDAFQQTVAACADDIIGPVHSKIAAQRQRGRLATLGIKATSNVVDLTINGIAGKLAGATIDRLGGRVPKRRVKEAKIACGILKSVLLYK